MTEVNSKAPEETVLSSNDEAVIKHMELYQSIITRLAGNSAGCKNFAIPLITAILGFIVLEKQVALIWLSILPILLFYFVDCYYLVLENQFRDSYDHDANKIQKGTFTRNDLFNLNPFKAASTKLKESNLPDQIKNEEDPEKIRKAYSRLTWSKSLQSPSTLPIYVGLLVLGAIAYGLLDFVSLAKGA
jgi:hypothetical protein